MNKMDILMISMIKYYRLEEHLESSTLRIVEGYKKMIGVKEKS
jgi:hypothetical protein